MNNYTHEEIKTYLFAIPRKYKIIIITGINGALLLNFYNLIDSKPHLIVV
jgi:hypothetical protein